MNKTNSNENSGKPETTEAYEVRQIPIDKIEVADFCRRREYPEEDMKTLQESIQKRGLIQNPVVLDNGNGKFTLIVGSRRFQACKALGWKTLPCRVGKGDVEDDAGLVSLSENIVRTIPHPADQGRFLKHRKEKTGLSDKELGLAQSSVTVRLNILDLGDDILAEIGSCPEDSFTLTHAGFLSQLMQTNRRNLQIEVRELLNKVKQFELSSGELDRLVQLYKDGSYDNLPGGLKDLLIKNKYMTARMAELFLCPEKFIDGDGHEAELLKESAHKLTEEKRQKLVQEAVDNKWSEDEIKKCLKRLLSPANPESNETNSAETLDSGLLSIMKQLEDSRYQLAEFGPDRISKLHKRCKQLIELLQSFVNTTTDIAKNKANHNTKESLKEESYESIKETT